MKKILKYISLLAGVAFLTAACSQSDIDGNASEEMGTLRLSVNIGGSRADAYNALDRSIMRVYKIENGEEKLIRKYQPATEAPGDFYLVAGSYRIKVEAGDQSQATFTNKSYYGELDVDIEPQQTVLKEVVCPTTNIGVKVVFDQTILDKMDPGFKAYVSAIDTFSKTEAENGSVPTLKYTENATGYYLLPEDVHNLSWGFYSSSTELGSVSKTGVIPTPESGNLYTLTFKYSKTPNGYLGITVQVDQDGEIHEDPFIFSPQPTIKGDGFDINSVIGFNTDDISFAVSSVQALSGISIKANDETIQVLSDVPELRVSAISASSDSRVSDVSSDGASCSHAWCGLRSMSMIEWASSNAPADCRRMSSALSANDCASGESPSLAASALSALAFRAIRDRECARVSCASAAMASASCWLVRSVCRVAACVVAALATAFAVRRRARERICRPMSVAMVTNTSEATVAVMMTVGSSTSITIGEPESPPVCG